MRRVVRLPTMSTLFASFARLLSATPAVRGGPALLLMERAEARAGQNPRSARELRQAAQA